jgi:hypothetical protein
VCEPGHSLPSGARVINERRYNSTSCVYLHGVQRKNFTFVCSTGFSLLSDCFKFFPVLSGNSEDFYVLGSRDSVVGLAIGKET